MKLRAGYPQSQTDDAEAAIKKQPFPSVRPSLPAECPCPRVRADSDTSCEKIMALGRQSCVKEM